MNKGTARIQKKEEGKLTSGTTKLTAIAPRRRLKNLGGSSCWSSWGSRTAPPLEKQSWGCRMMRWRRSTREGSIYRTKRARANLTYLFAVSVKSEGTQVDMVTVRMIIKGLRR
jgi:hypothetical protein